MKILVINAGSSSFKYQVIDMHNKRVLSSGLVERIGESNGVMIHKIFPGTPEEQKIRTERMFANHIEGMEHVVAAITNPEIGVISSVKEIQGIGHRVVMGGETIKTSVLITQDIKKIIKDCFSLSPLHGPANLSGIEVAEKLFPGIPNVGVFDTEFHQTLPEYAYMYPLPYHIYTDYKIRRYGFHGTSHRYVANEAAQFLQKSLKTTSLITCHLGNGCSMAAIKDGICIDTTMGTTPLDGLMMGTRCGSIDPAIVPFLLEKTGMSASDLDTLMNKQSGLKGISGMNDMRDIHEACSKGNEKAQLALDMFVYRIKKQIGAYYAILPQLDALVFTAGIGENDTITRKLICRELTHLGFELDDRVNSEHASNARVISKKSSSRSILVIPTNEELEIAKATQSIIQNM